MPVKDLRDSILQGVLWLAAQQWSEQTLRFLLLVILSRLLTPEAFGLIALANVYVALTRLLLDQGFGAALVQRRDLDALHLDVTFWGHVALAGVLATISFAAADFIAAVLREPRLAPLLQVFALSLLLQPLVVVPVALLRRHLRFQAIALRTAAAQLFAGAVAVAAAWYGLGVWSLVLRQLTELSVLAALFWGASQWRPRVRFSWPHLAELWSFGGNLTGLNLLGFLRRNADYLLVGVFLGSMSLGLYSVARRLVEAVSLAVVHVVWGVAWPAFSRLQDQPEQLKRALLAAARSLALIGCPAFLGAAALAPALMEGTLGQQWEPGIPVLAAFAVIGLIQAVSGVALIALLAVGAAGARLRIELWAAGVALLVGAAALPWGIAAVAGAQAAVACLMLPIQVWMASRRLPIRSWAYLASYARPLLLATAMASTVWVAYRMLDAHLTGPWLLAVLITLGALAYTSLVLFFARPQVREAWSYARSAMGLRPGMEML